LDTDEMPIVMRHLGSYLGGRTRLYLMHPFRSDNSCPVEWEGRQIPPVRWGDTTPYDLVELTSALDRKVQVCILGKHRYYHQVYSLMRITVK